MSVSQYVIFWSVLFIGFGAIWYNLDRRFGVRWYRSWYNMTHKNKLTEDKAIGFIYNRSTHSKAASAAFIATLQSILVAWYMEVNLLVALIMWLAETPLMMLGFYLAPLACAIWRKKEILFKTVDKVESGELQVGAEVSRVAKRMVAPVRERLEAIQSNIEAAISGDDDDSIVEQPSPDDLRLKELEETDPRKLMSKFTKQGGD
ncbi:MAG: hypothetical protein Q7K65_03115 [Candidatus Buchananbacteria bacterium]|nr:hypothetical protein [Candidatus Buchananbacteria bacterium]